METYESIIFCSFLHAESEFEDCFLLSALKQSKTKTKNSQKWVKHLIFLQCYCADKRKRSSNSNSACRKLQNIMVL